MFKKIHLHPETPIEVKPEKIFENDTLGFESSVKNLASLIQNVIPPFTIGIYGDWGSGKTSFMKLLREYLETEGGIQTCWFNAWEYENEDALILPLLSMLKKDLGGNDELFDSTKKIASSLMLVGSNVFLKAVTAGAIDIHDIKGSLETYEKSTSEIWDIWIDNSQKLKSKFKELVNKIKKDKPFVAIFIDDLDRCSPDNVVKTIENIKHYLSVEGANCVFIVGVDKGILAKGIQVKYGSHLIRGEEYLEKIINLSFQVPCYAGENDARYLNDIIKGFVVPEWYNEINSRINVFCDLVSKLKFNNPRKIRLLVQRYLFFLTIEDSKSYIEDIVIRLIIYKEFFPKAYAQKKEAGKIGYYPSSGNMNTSFGSMTFEEMSGKVGEDFAIIFKDERFTFLKNFDSVSETLRQHVLDFSEEQYLENIKLLQGINPPDTYELIKKYIEGNYKRYSKDYFDLIDLLFSLARG